MNQNLKMLTYFDKVTCRQIYVVNQTEKYWHFLLWMCQKLRFILSRNLSDILLRQLMYHSYSYLPFYMSAHDYSDNFCLIRTAVRNMVIKELCQCLICLPSISVSVALNSIENYFFSSLLSETKIFLHYGAPFYIHVHWIFLCHCKLTCILFHLDGSYSDSVWTE